MARGFEEVEAGQAAVETGLARHIATQAGGRLLGSGREGLGGSNAVERSSHLAALIERQQQHNAELDQLCGRLERIAELVVGPAPQQPERPDKRDRITGGDPGGPPTNAMHATRQNLAAVDYMLARLCAVVSRLEEL